VATAPPATHCCPGYGLAGSRSSTL
jgi:hypothetical protein